MKICDKIKNINLLMKEECLDAILLINTKNIRERNIDYFVSQPVYDFPCLLIITNDKIKLVTSLLEDIKERGIEILKTKNPISKEIVLEHLKESKTIGIIEDNFPLSIRKFLKGKRLVDISKKMAKNREIKSIVEIRKIKFSCKIAEECINEIKENISRRTKENEIVKMIKSVIAKYEEASLAFNPIVASGNRLSIIHPFPQYSSRMIKDFCIVDFGIRYKGYCCDVTIPFVLGYLNNKKRKIIETVDEAYRKTLEMIKHTKEVSEIFRNINEFIKISSGCELKHALGHGIGLDVHEPPDISISSEEELKDGMVFTIEPGIYTKSFGCRIENVVYLKNGVKTLSNAEVVEKL
ncbi:MAG: Xaa-Pro peptidase family protein [Candidatus Aenigmarchaeota archaeon]|nr:Xaa-Pro peptidase family protein [Candidatus Aenigmarchaeota archaeon]